MPARHSAPGPSRTPWLIAAVLIILAGVIAAGFLLWQKFQGGSGGRAAMISPAPTASPAAAPTPAPTASPTPTPEPTPEPTPTPAPIPDNGEDGYLSEGLYIWNNMAFELFYGYDESAQPYAEAISRYAEQLPGVRVYSMVVPNHSEFGLPERLRDSLGCGSQRANTSLIYGSYGSGVTPVDIYDALNQHKEEPIYFNTDTHWTALGAYYAYEVFCAQAEVSAAPLSDFAKSSYPDFLGYLYQMTGDSALESHPDQIDLYEPGFSYTAEVSYDGESFTPLAGINSADSSMGYSMLLWGDNPCLRVVNESSQTGRKLALVKESYGNAIGAFLAASFDQVYAVDFRSFEGSLPAFCQENGITDLLFLNSTMAANTYARVEDLNRLFPE